MRIETINPTTGNLIEQYNPMPDQTIVDIIEKTHLAYLEWQALPLKKRAQSMQHVASLLLENEDEYASLITTEMGKPIVSARAEIEKCAKVCRYYADHAEKMLSPQVIETEMSKSYVTYNSTGIIFGIMPWNFPFWQVFRYAVPNLMAGNAVLLKHAPNSTGVALTIEKLFRFAGFPENLFRALVIEVEQAEVVIAHPHVSGVTLTGSERAGKSVASLAGKHLKKIVLELGSSDPYLVLLDADLDLAADTCVVSRLNNSGQVCIAAKRFIAVKDVKESFQRLVLQKCEQHNMGDPMDETTQLGPLARADLREKVHQQVQESIEKGAKLLMGGFMPETDGYYYPVTVLDNVKPGMPAYDDEIFGPVIALIEAEDEQDAIRIANDTRFGLSAAVFTQDFLRGEKIAAEKLNVGTCCVNRLVSSDPRLPFGGTKGSGFGRELSAYGIHEFMNIKTVCID